MHELELPKQSAHTDLGPRNGSDRTQHYLDEAEGAFEIIGMIVLPVTTKILLVPTQSHHGRW